MRDVVPKLSVVLPVYGVEQYLEECLLSLRNQTLTALEVIIVDDGSLDRCGHIADRWADADPRFKVLHTANGGLGVARNRGAAIATGEYITFADSDDLIPPRAYELMVSTLDETGSDFAAGNAWRFAEGIGTVQSWTHGRAFRQTRLQTHISEFHELLRDRMIWNKVYRRSFWDAAGFEFPDMKYEDYPVTLRAHLIAQSVDVLSDKVYMWRNRESGDSITQQLARVGNARDRVRSAEMLLDILARERPDPDLVADVHAYLIDVDVVALATALVTGEEGDLPELEALALRLARALTPAPGKTMRLAGLIHASLRDGDLDLARTLVGWRLDPNRKRLLKQIVSGRSRWMVPKVVRAIIPRRRRRGLHRPLRSTLVEFARHDDHFLVHSTSLLSPGFVKRARVESWLVGDESEIRLDTRMHPLGDGFKVISRIPADQLLPPGNARLEIRVRSGALRWSGPISAPTDQLPGPIESLLGRWYVASAVGGMAGINSVVLPVVGDISLRPDGLRVELGSGPRGSLVVARPAPTPDLVVPFVDGVATVGLEELVAGDAIDNPFSGIAYRKLAFLPEAMVEACQQRPLHARAWPDSLDRGDFRYLVHGDAVGAAQLVLTFLPTAEPATHVAEDLTGLIGRERSDDHIRASRMQPAPGGVRISG